MLTREGLQGAVKYFGMIVRDAGTPSTLIRTTVQQLQNTLEDKLCMSINSTVAASSKEEKVGLGFLIRDSVLGSSQSCGSVEVRTLVKGRVRDLSQDWGPW